MKLLKKEFRLCLHPAAVVMLALSAMVLIPNYPYTVTFFYMTLGIYFICLSGRENHDAAYTLTLPVSRGDAVRGRVLFAVCLQAAQLALCAALLPAHAALLGDTPNLAGLDANIALPGEGLIVFGVFNVVFFTGFYKNINRVGTAFVKACAAVFVCVTLDVVCSHAIPFMRDVLDTPDPAHTGAKLAFDAACLAAYVALTALAVRVSTRRFEAQDLAL